MGTRTVRLDEKTEETLEQIVSATGLSISEVLKRGVRAVYSELAAKSGKTPYDVYSGLDLGPGGYAVAGSKSSKSAVKDAIRRKHRR